LCAGLDSTGLAALSLLPEALPTEHLQQRVQSSMCFMVCWVCQSAKRQRPARESGWSEEM
jgi:hypothetical protein